MQRNKPLPRSVSTVPSLAASDDNSVIDSHVRQLQDHPTPYKEVEGRRIYQSRADFGKLRKGIGNVKISDFGAAVFGNVSTPHRHDIQPK
jgi:hypothetical protein